MATITFINGPRKDEKAVIKEGKTVFGSDDGSGIILRHTGIAGSHAEIVREGVTYHISDLGSAGGTFVNGRKIAREELHDGDEIVAGTIRITFALDQSDRKTVVRAIESSGKKTVVREVPETPEIRFGLKGLNEAFKDKQFTIQGKTGIGRDEGNAVRIDSDKVSRNHALISPDGDALAVIDLGGANGTFINGKRLIPNTPTKAGVGDKVRFDLFEFQVIDCSPKKTVVREIEPGPAYVLQGISASVSGMKIPLTGEIRIGRDRKNSVVIDAEGVSATHARLELVNGEPRITDLGSTNGTKVNAVRINAQAAVELKAGDRIAFDFVEFVVADERPKKTVVRDLDAGTAPPAETAEAMAYLIIEPPATFSGGTSRVPLTKDYSYVGSDPNQCPIVIPDKTVSARHCKIRFEDEQWHITDSGSVNGTYVAGKKAIGPKTSLPFGADITIGSVTLRLEQSSQTKSARSSTETKVVEIEEQKPKWFTNPILLSSIAAIVILAIAAPLILYQPSAKGGSIIFRKRHAVPGAEGLSAANTSILLLPSLGQQRPRIVQSAGKYVRCIDLWGKDYFKLANKSFTAPEDILGNVVAAGYQNGTPAALYFTNPEQLTVLDQNGALLAQFPSSGAMPFGKLSAPPAPVGDPGGGSIDVAVVTENGMTAVLERKRNFEPRWVSAALSGVRISCSPSSMDINRDKYPDIVVAADNGRVAVLNGVSEGYPLMEFVPASAGFSHSPLTGDFDRDGVVDIVAIDNNGMFHWYIGKLPDGNKPGQEQEPWNAGKPTGDIVFSGSGKYPVFLIPTEAGLQWADVYGRKIGEWRPQSGKPVRGTPCALARKDGYPDVIVMDDEGNLNVVRYVQGDRRGKPGIALVNSFRCDGAATGKVLAVDPVKFGDADEDGVLDAVVAYKDGSIEVITTGGYAVPRGSILTFAK